MVAAVGYEPTPPKRLVLQLERNAPKDGVTRIMHERIRYLNETLNIAMHNYADPSFSNRTKRGLINGLV